MDIMFISTQTSASTEHLKKLLGYSQHRLHEFPVTEYNNPQMRDILKRVDALVVLLSYDLSVSDPVYVVLSQAWTLEKKICVGLLEKCVVPVFSEGLSYFDLTSDQFQNSIESLLETLQQMTASRSLAQALVSVEPSLIENSSKLENTQKQQYITINNYYIGSTTYDIGEAAGSAIGHQPIASSDYVGRLVASLQERMTKALGGMMNIEPEKSELKMIFNFQDANVSDSSIGNNPKVEHTQNYGMMSQLPVDLGVARLRALFEEVNRRLDALEAADRELLKPAVEQTAQATAAIQQGDETPEKQTFLEARLKAIYAMRKDIGEVIIATLANPALGLALVLHKIGQKVQAELGMTEEPAAA
ncbi:MAG: hypothetical protein WHX52_16275 [Anaerolineae bacterium]